MNDCFKFFWVTLQAICQVSLRKHSENQHDGLSYLHQEAKDQLAHLRKFFSSNCRDHEEVVGFAVICPTLAFD